METGNSKIEIRQLTSLFFPVWPMLIVGWKLEIRKRRQTGVDFDSIFQFPFSSFHFRFSDFDSQVPFIVNQPAFLSSSRSFAACWNSRSSSLSPKWRFMNATFSIKASSASWMFSKLVRQMSRQTE